MKRLIILFLCVCISGACSNKQISTFISGSGDFDNSVVIEDENIIGSWQVIKYEAFDRNEKLLDTATDEASIAATYSRFDFDTNGIMSLYAKGQRLTTNYAYYASGNLLFGESGLGETCKLDKTSFIFDSDSFFPVGWNTKYPANAGGFYRVHCTRNPS